ncbi:MAG: LytTR family DNA-binding domain-containing protein [Clostridia bacterium]|nr:LytTR family DNA-binding domain-containing protein [Clostridia bacterium]
MMKIAICDDENYYINLFENWIDDLKQLYSPLEYDVFSSGEELIRAYDKTSKPYNVIFLDVEMGKMNGIETAKKIRKLDKSVIIVFVTSHEQYVFDSFEAKPFRYLTKPVAFDNFKKTFHAAYNELHTQNKVFTFSYKFNTFTVYYHDILYFESSKREVIVHCLNDEYRFYGKIRDLQENIDDDRFFLVHNSYFVNMEFVNEFNYKFIRLHNGTILPISDSRRKDVRKQYFDFLSRRVDNE